MFDQQQFSLFMARKLLSQIDEEGSFSSFWVVGVIFRLAMDYPDMSMQELLMLVSEEMPVHFDAYVKDIKRCQSGGSKLIGS